MAISYSEKARKQGSANPGVEMLFISTITLVLAFFSPVYCLPPPSSSSRVSPRSSGSLANAVGSISSPVFVAAQATVAVNAKVTPVSSCVHVANPDVGIDSACECYGYSGYLPVLAGTSGCSYTAVTGTPMLPTTILKPTTGALVGFPYTSTAPNSALIAYASTMETGEGETLYLGASTTLSSGKIMRATQDPSTSANVGTLTGEQLYTSVSNALMAGCTITPSSGASVTTCHGEVPKVTGIVWTDNQGNWYDDGELEFTVQGVSYCDMASLQGMVSSFAATLKGSSLTTNSTWTPEPLQCPPLEGCADPQLPKGGQYSGPITNVPGWVNVQFLKDVEDTDCQLQQLIVEVAMTESQGAFLCSDGALITDTLAALALVPGLDILSFMAIPALGVSVTCATIDNINSG